MAYTKQVWKNLPDQTTPLSAERLNHLETQYSESVAQSNELISNAVGNLLDQSILPLQVSSGTGLDARMSAVFNTGVTVIAFCGSSTTQIGGWVRSFMHGVHSRWRTGEIYTLAQASGVVFPTGIHAVNAGISGAGAATYLDSARAAQVSATNPSIVFHMVGSSDFRNGNNPVTYEANLESAINRVTSSKPILHILVHSFARMDPGIVRPGDWHLYGQAMKRVADRRTDCLFVDVSETFKLAGVSPGGDNRYGLMSNDLIHLGPEGDVALGDVIAQRLSVSGSKGTGWVDLKPYLASGVTLNPAGTVLGKRSGDVVTLVFQQIEGSFAANASVDILTGIPAELQPTQWQAWGSAWGGSGTARAGVCVSRPASGTVGVVFNAAQTNVRGTVTYVV